MANLIGIQIQNACPFPPGIDPPRKQASFPNRISLGIPFKKYLPRKGYLLTVLLLTSYFSVFVYAICEPKTNYAVYVDDISVIIDGKIIYSTDFSSNHTDELQLGNRYYNQITNRDYRSPPYSVGLGFRSYPSKSEEEDVYALELEIRFSEWGTINATWYAKIGCPGINSPGDKCHIFSAKFHRAPEETYRIYQYSTFEAVVQPAKQPFQNKKYVYASFWNYGYYNDAGHYVNSCSSTYSSDFLMKPWNSDRWYEFSLVFKKGDETARLYIDGCLACSMSLAKCNCGPLEKLIWLGFYR